MNKYAFGDMILLYNGIPLTGYAEGDDVITVKRRVDTFTDKVGADGKMTAVKSSDRSGEITLKFMQGSSGSAIMDNFFALQESTFATSAFSLYNPITLETFSGGTCYIKKPADAVRGAGLNSEEWTIVAENIFLLRSAGSALGAFIGAIKSVF